MSTKFSKNKKSLPVIITVIFLLGLMLTGGIVASTGGNTTSPPAQSPKSTSTSHSSTATIGQPITIPQPPLMPTMGNLPIFEPKPITTLPKFTYPSSKPAVVYIGAEWCPFCAAERWPLVIALQNFGTFKGLQTMESSPSDVYPNTPTITFIHSKYSSKYISFVPTETMTRNRKPLQAPPKAVQVLQTTFAKSPFKVPTNAIPFIDIANIAYMPGAQYSPQILAGLSQKQVIADIHNPKSKVGFDINASANAITYYICHADGGHPANICSHFGM